MLEPKWQAYMPVIAAIYGFMFEYIFVFQNMCSHIRIHFVFRNICLSPLSIPPPHPWGTLEGGAKLFIPQASLLPSTI